jgi:hypothetical protein
MCYTRNSCGGLDGRVMLRILHRLDNLLTDGGDALSTGRGLAPETLFFCFGSAD